MVQRPIGPVFGARAPACSLPRTLAVPGGTPLALALDPGAHLLIVATPAGLDLLDSCTGKLKARKDAGGLPSQLAVDGSAGRALVLVAPRVRLFDTHKLRWLSNLGLPGNAYPKQIAVAGGTHEALVLDPGNATLWVADTRSGVVGHHVANLPGTQEAVAMDAARRKAFVASVGTNTVSIIDTIHWKVVHTTTVGVWPLALVVSSRTGRVFVANRDSKSVSILDAATGQVLHTVALRAKPQALAIDERLGRVYVALQSTGKVKQGQLVVLDAATGGASKAHTLGPQGPTVTVDPTTGTIYYLDPTSGTITVLPPTAPGKPTTKAATAHPSATKAPTTPKRSHPRQNKASVPTATATPTNTPTNTPRPTATATPTNTPTNTPRPTATSTFTPVPTNTTPPTSTFTPVPTSTFTPLPTSTATPTATSTPTPAPTVVLSSGNVTLPANAAFSFDSGTVVSTGGDVWWDDGFAPMGGATLVNVGNANVVDFTGLSLATLKTLSYSTAPIGGSDQLQSGDIFAVHTIHGNYAKVWILSLAQVVGGVSPYFAWVTYQGS